jgi:hypothetical protein
VVDSHDVLSNTGHYKIVHEDPRMGTLAEIYGKRALTLLPPSSMPNMTQGFS